MLNDVFKLPRHLVQQSVEHMLKQILKPFKPAFDARARALVTIIGFDLHLKNIGANFANKSQSVRRKTKKT